jgi:putative hemolysin
MSNAPVQIRFAKTEEEVKAAQRLRYRIFYEIGKAKGATDQMIHERRDFDKFDDHCKHLIAVVLETQEVVGSYRLLSEEGAAQCGGFYSENEYDLSSLKKNGTPILELGRACVDSDYQKKGLIQSLWKAIAFYVRQNNIKTLFGCANFPTTSVDNIKEGLSYLYAQCLAPEHIRTKALPNGYIEMNQCDISGLDPILIYQQLPPLVKGYLRVGGTVGEGAFFDREFGSIDVCIIMETEKLNQRYSQLHDLNLL